MTTLDPETAQLLRRAVQLAGARPVTVADLRRAIDEPADEPLPPAHLRADAAVAALVRRAADVATARQAETIGRADLVEALLESEADAAGLDLERLRFARWRIRTLYGAVPAARECRLHSSSLVGEESS